MGQKSIPQIIYHYCNLDRFLSITKNKELWLTDICKSNDSMEREWIYKLFDLCWNQIMKKPNVDEASSAEEIYHSYAIKQIQKEYQVTYNHVKAFKSLSECNFTPCGICFSSEKDLLSQWRGYANDGKGIAIGFNSLLFKEAVSPTNSRNVRFDKIEYKINRQIDFVSNVIMEWFRCNNGVEKESPEVILASLKMSSKLWDKAMFFKNPAFKEEREWRFVVNNHKLNGEMAKQCIETASYTIMPREWLAREDMIVPYRKLVFEKANKPIASIVIGPKTNLSVKDMQMYLYDLGFDIEKIMVHKSISTYR